jgi:tRNA A-37 threonylcarbamoyl transferase component Bud32
MIYRLITLPFNVAGALIALAWTESQNHTVYRPYERDLVLIPYDNRPLVALRSKINSLPKAARWASVATFLLPCAFLYCTVFTHFVSKSIIFADVIFSVLAGVASVCLALLAYLMFGVLDVIQSDRFSFLLPIVWLNPRLRLKQYEGTRNAWLKYQHNRVFWSDLLELSIVDRSSHGKRHNFKLRLVRKSSSDLEIPIENIPKSSVALLAGEIEKNAPFCRNLSQLAEIARFQDYQKGLLPGVMYEQLWESLTAKRIDATSFAPLVPNYKLQGGRLTIVRQIASGGFSAVYLAEEPDGAKVILKEFVLPFNADHDLAKKASEHFAREARLLKALRHRQIARVYDHFVEEGRNYLLVEYIKGRTLRQLVFDEGPQAEHIVLSYAIQLAQILEYLHGQEVPIIHRDLTPDNLIVGEYGKLFLIDFGSANEFTGAATGTLVGKHAYMSPEQVRGKTTPLSDIYSFGQTIYYGLTAAEPKPLMSSKLPRAQTKLGVRLNQVIQQCTELEAEKRVTLPALINSLIDSSQYQEPDHD